MNTGIKVTHMRVLHIWNPAAVPSILSKYLRTKGILSDVIMRKSFDGFGFEKAYSENTKYHNVSSLKFYFLALKKSNNYDIIHVHSIDKIVPLIKLYTRKPVLLHYHGTDIRGLGNSILKKTYSRFSDIVLVSTLDLLSDIPSAIYLPNPVDLDLFHDKNKIRKKNSAIFFLTYPDHEGVLKTVNTTVEKMKLNLLVYNRRFKNEKVPYLRMPNLFSSYEYFLDRIILKDLSKTALEALASGVKVIKDDKIFSQIPKEHNPYTVVKRLIDIYEKIS
jgi:hypothetical protein